MITLLQFGVSSSLWRLSGMVMYLRSRHSEELYLYVLLWLELCLFLWWLDWFSRFSIFKTMRRKLLLKLQTPKKLPLLWGKQFNISMPRTKAKNTARLQWVKGKIMCIMNTSWVIWREKCVVLQNNSKRREQIMPIWCLKKTMHKRR